MTFLSQMKPVTFLLLLLLLPTSQSSKAMVLKHKCIPSHLMTLQIRVHHFASIIPQISYKLVQVILLELRYPNLKSEEDHPLVHML